MTRIHLLTFSMLAALAAPALAQPVAPTAAPPADKPAPAQGARTGTPAPGPVARMSPPAGWVADDGRAAGIVKSMAGERHFGGVPIGLDAQYLRSPEPGALLISSQIVTESVPAAADAVASAELQTAREGADAVTGAKVVRWEIKIDPNGRVHQALLEWTDPSVGTTSLSRTLVFRTSAGLARISAECVLGPDAAALRPACETALGSLTANAGDLQPLAVTDQPVAATDPVAAIDPVVAPAPGTTPRSSSSGPTIGERDAALPSTVLVRSPPPKAADRRPLYVVGGLVLLGLAFWWNRRSRREAEAATEAAARAVERSAVSKKDDDDAGDGDAGDDDAPVKKPAKAGGAKVAKSEKSEKSEKADQGDDDAGEDGGAEKSS